MRWGLVWLGAGLMAALASSGEVLTELGAADAAPLVGVLKEPVDSRTQEGFAQLDALGPQPSFDAYAQVAESIFRRARPARVLGDGAGARPEDALSFRPDGGKIQQGARVYMVPTADDVEAAQQAVHNKSAEREAAKRKLLDSERRVQQLKWMLKADRTGENAKADGDKLKLEQQAVVAAEKQVQNSIDALGTAKAKLRAVSVAAARDIYYTTDGSAPTKRSLRYDPKLGIKMAGMHRQEIRLRAIAVSEGGTGSSDQSFTIQASLIQQAQEQMEIVLQKTSQGIETAAKTDQWVPLAWSKVEHAHSLHYEATMLTKKNCPMESEFVEKRRQEAKAQKRDFKSAQESLKESEQQIGKLKEAQQVTVRKYKQSLVDLQNAQESYDGSSIFLRSATWTAHMEKSQAKHRYMIVTDKLKVAKMKHQTTRSQKERQASELEQAEIVAKEASESADDTSSEEVAAADARKFEEMKAVKREEDYKETQKQQLEIAARKGEAAAADAKRSAEAVAAAQDDPASAVNVAKEALAGGKLAAEKAAAEQTAMNEAAAQKEAIEEGMKQKTEEFKAKQEEAEKGINEEDAQQETVFKATQKYMTSRLELENAELAASQLNHTLKGTSLVHLQALKLLEHAEKWYHETEVDKYQSHVEYLQAENVSLLWGAELKQRRQIQKLAEAAEAQVRRDMLSAEAAKLLAKAAVIKSEALRRAIWKKTYYLETKVTRLHQSGEHLQSVIDVARQESEEEIRLEQEDLEKQVKALAKERVELEDAEQNLVDAKKQTQEEKEIAQEADVMQADGVLKGDAQKKADEENKQDSANKEVDAEKALENANNTLYYSTQQAAGAQRNLQIAIAAANKTQSKGARLQWYLNRLKPMVMFAINATERSKATALACDEYQRNATRHAETADEMYNRAVKEHKMKYQDMLAKQADTRNVTEMLSNAVEYAKSKSRHLARAEATRIEWEERLKLFKPYAGEQQKKFKRVVRAHISAVNALPEKQAALADSLATMQAQAEQLTLVQERVLAMVEAGCNTPSTPFEAKPAPYLELMIKYRDMQKKWAVSMVEEHKMRLRKATVADQRAKVPVISYTIAQKLEWKARAFMFSEQDSLMRSNELRTETQFEYRKKCKQALVARNTERLNAITAFHIGEAEVKASQGMVELQETSYQNKSLFALRHRVMEGWGWSNKEQLMPKLTESHRMKRAVFQRVVAAWQPDGTPEGPGSIAAWDMRADGALYSVDGQVNGFENGYLHPNITSSCSSTCEPYAEAECHEGRLSLACTRGQVFRARYLLSNNVVNHTLADWLVCRCNHGSMQMVGLEPLSVRHLKSNFVQGQIPEHNATAVTFTQRLRDAEAIPDPEAMCWIGFMKWIQTSSTIAKSRAALERNALAPPQAAEAVYRQVRQEWYQACLQKPDVTAPSLGINEYWGSTDGSFNILSLSRGKGTDSGPTAEERAASHAEMIVNEAQKAAKAKLEQERRLAKTIFPGDAETVKATDKGKSDDVAVDPAEPLPPIAAKAEEQAANENSEGTDTDAAAEVLAKVQTDFNSKKAHLEVSTAQLKEAEIALERAQRAKDQEGATNANQRIKSTKTRVDMLKLELESAGKLLAELSTPPPQLPLVEVQSTGKGIKWHVGPKAFSSDMPAQSNGVCTVAFKSGGTESALKRAFEESMDRPGWKVTLVDAPGLCEGQFRASQGG